MILSTLLCGLLVAFQGGTAETKPQKGQPASRNAAPSAIYVRGKLVYTMSGKAISNGAVVIRDGKIAAVGADLPVPEGAQVLEAEVVTPGLIDANSTAGQLFGGLEDSSEICGGVRVLDNVDLGSSDFQLAAKNGVTTVFEAPSNRAVIGGLGALVKTFPAGKQSVLSGASVLKGSLSNETMFGNGNPRGFGIPQSFRIRRPNSRPGAVMEMRLALLAAQSMVGKLGIVPPDWKPIVDVFEANFPIRIHALTLGELRATLRVAREFGISNLTIDGAQEANRCLEELRKSNAKLVLGPHPIDPMNGTNGLGRGIDYGDEAPALDVLAQVAAAGIPYALGTYGDSRGLVDQARIAVRYGADPEIAMNAITKGAAEVLGISNRVGSLAVGMDGDLVLWSGNPLEWTSETLAVVVDGKIAHRRPSSTK